MTDLLFATPWWLPTLICGVAVVLFVTANNRQERGLRNAAVGIFMLGIAIALVSYFVETPREKVDRRTRQLVSDVVAGNWDNARSLLGPQVHLARLHGPPELISAMQLAQTRVQVTSAHILSMTTDELSNEISVSINVLTYQQATMDRPITSRWRFDWRPTENHKEWKLAQIVCLGAGRLSAEQIESQIPGARQ